MRINANYHNIDPKELVELLCESCNELGTTVQNHLQWKSVELPDIVEEETGSSFSSDSRVHWSKVDSL
jgi:hypothetical protein